MIHHQCFPFQQLKNTGGVGGGGWGGAVSSAFTLSEAAATRDIL